MFTFWFEAEATAGAVPEAVVGRVPTGLEPGQPRNKVLIVDDVATNRELLDELLSGIGFSTRAAASGEEAIVVHDEWQPDLVLMDLRMPGIDGFEAVRQLRKSGSTAVIISVTASSEPGAERHAFEAGIDAFVRKPYREEVLLAIIGEHLGVRYTYEPKASADVERRARHRDVVAGAASEQPAAGVARSAQRGRRRRTRPAARSARGPGG